MTQSDKSDFEKRSHGVTIRVPAGEIVDRLDELSAWLLEERVGWASSELEHTVDQLRRTIRELAR